MFTVRWTYHAYETCNPGNQMPACNKKKKQQKIATETDKVTQNSEHVLVRSFYVYLVRNHVFFFCDCVFESLKCFCLFNSVGFKSHAHTHTRHNRIAVVHATNYIMMEIILCTKVISFFSFNKRLLSVRIFSSHLLLVIQFCLIHFFSCEYIIFFCCCLLPFVLSSIKRKEKQ